MAILSSASRVLVRLSSQQSLCHQSSRGRFREPAAVAFIIDRTAAFSSAPAPSPQDETKSGIDPEKSSESQAEAPPSAKGEDVPFSSKPNGSHSSEPASKSKPQASKQTYPLYPSITQLLHQNGVPLSDADKIPASGPKGRLLKGDVLAYLGAIAKSYSTDQSNRISKLGHLDLSNIKVAPPKEMPAVPSKDSPPKISATGVEVDPHSEVAVTISLTSVLEVQKRVQASLGVTLPLSTFIARATEVANDGLPRPRSSTPDDLFNSILGLDKVSSNLTRGSFTPQITALPSTLKEARSIAQRANRKPDIIDLLSQQQSSPARKRLPKPAPKVIAESASELPTSVFSVVAPKGDEKRAKVFLERMKTILQVEPGSRTYSHDPKLLMKLFLSNLVLKPAWFGKLFTAVSSLHVRIC